MIVDLLVTAVLGCINAVIGLMPTWTLPVMTPANGLQLQRYMNALAFLVPATALLVVIGGNLALRGIVSGWGLVVFIYHQFWGSD